MAAGVMVSVEKYLATTYRPDCDYIDGEIVERNLGERPHSSTQRAILAFFIRHYPNLEQLMFPEQRVQVKPTRFRIPDICLLRENAPYEPVVHIPPLLCIEILSRDDSLSEIARRIDDYLEMGVEICWIIDPLSRSAWTASRAGELIRAVDDTLHAPGIEMPLTSVLPPLS